MRIPLPPRQNDKKPKRRRSFDSDDQKSVTEDGFAREVTFNNGNTHYRVDLETGRIETDFDYSYSGHPTETVKVTRRQEQRPQPRSVAFPQGELIITERGGVQWTDSAGTRALLAPPPTPEQIAMAERQRALTELDIYAKRFAAQQAVDAAAQSEHKGLYASTLQHQQAQDALNANWEVYARNARNRVNEVNQRIDALNEANTGLDPFDDEMAYARYEQQMGRLLDERAFLEEGFFKAKRAHQQRMNELSKVQTAGRQAIEGQQKARQQLLEDFERSTESHIRATREEAPQPWTPDNAAPTLKRSGMSPVAPAQQDGANHGGRILDSLRRRVRLPRIQTPRG